MEMDESDRRFPVKKFIQSSEEGAKTQKSVAHDSQTQRPKKIEYRFSKGKASPAKSGNSQGTKGSLEEEEENSDQHKELRYEKEVSQITFQLNGDEEDEILSQKGPNTPPNELTLDLIDNERESEYYNKWDELIEIERQQDNIIEKAEVRLPVIFHSIVTDDYKQLIFYEKFQDKKKCEDFYKKTKKLTGKIKIFSLSGFTNPEEPGFVFYELEGIVKEIKAPYQQDKWICILYILSPNPLTHQLKPNSRCEIREQKSNLFDQMKSQMARLCEESSRKFDLIGALRTPKFKTGDSLRQFWPFYKDQLNSEQQEALEKCLMAKDYSLIHGLPGTGKTYIIVILLRILLERGEKVLLSSHSSSAIDRILDRFIQDYPNLKSKITRKGRNEISESMADLISTEDTSQIIALTCQAAVTSNLEGVQFDTCIIDEAPRTLEPVVLGSLLLAKKFILVGDHFQLGPLVKGKEAKEKGMCISLFERLARAHRSAVSTLKIQYRMNQEIMNFSNILVYGNSMSCATERIKTGRLKLTSKKDDKWVEETLDPNKPVVLLNVVKPDQTANIDSKLTNHLVQKLVSSGVSLKDIGVITPLNDTVDLIKRYLNENKNSVEVFSFDGCQGIEKQCIIINFSLDKQRTSGLLRDWKRVNVAFTRAKHKLIMIGSIVDIKTIDNMKEYMHLIESDSHIVNITTNNLKSLKH